MRVVALYLSRSQIQENVRVKPDALFGRLQGFAIDDVVNGWRTDVPRVELAPLLLHKDLWVPCTQEF